MVRESKAARHDGGAERAVQPRLIGRHQLTVHLPVTPAAATQIHTAHTYTKRYTITQDLEQHKGVGGGGDINVQNVHMGQGHDFIIIIF